jgi:hypothetical protein
LKLYKYGFHFNLSEEFSIIVFNCSISDYFNGEKGHNAKRLKCSRYFFMQIYIQAIYSHVNSTITLLFQVLIQFDNRAVIVETKNITRKISMKIKLFVSFKNLEKLRMLSIMKKRMLSFEFNSTSNLIKDIQKLQS